jgi:hypothetical protein
MSSPLSVISLLVLQALLPPAQLLVLPWLGLHCGNSASAAAAARQNN